MSLNKALVLLFAVGFAASFASAQNCWEQHQSPQDWYGHGFWLCVKDSQKGSIRTTAPYGHPSYGRYFLVELQSFDTKSPYPATLFCYGTYTDIEPYKGATPSSIKPRTMAWHYLAQVTLNDEQQTNDETDWEKAGCPWVANHGHNSSNNPAEVYIVVNWGMTSFGQKVSPTPRVLQPWIYGNKSPAEKIFARASRLPAKRT